MEERTQITQVPENERWCLARQCSIKTPDRFLMCEDHWRAVPERIRRRLWELRRAQNIDPRAGSEHLQLMLAAVVAAGQDHRRLRKAS